MKREASYLCGLCQKNRHVKIDVKDIRKRISSSSNGLAQISDIHHCADGILSVNNLHIDHNIDVRSFSMMELPDKKRKSSNIAGIPMPTQQTSSNTYRITRMFDNKVGYRLRLMNDQLRVAIIIGDVDKEEDPEAIYVSDNKSVRLEYYESQIPLRRNNRSWFMELVNALEQLPPTRLGLFLEALRYVHSMNEKEPDSFEIEQLRTLLSSHKTRFTILPHNYKSLKNITSKYGKDKRPAIDAIISAVKDNPELTLQEIQPLVKQDLIFIIYLAILLEMEGVLEIHRDLTEEVI